MPDGWTCTHVAHTQSYTPHIPHTLIHPTCNTHATHTAHPHVHTHPMCNTHHTLIYSTCNIHITYSNMHAAHYIAFITRLISLHRTCSRTTPIHALHIYMHHTHIRYKHARTTPHTLVLHINTYHIHMHHTRHRYTHQPNHIDTTLHTHHTHIPHKVHMYTFPSTTYCMHRKQTIHMHTHRFEFTHI